MVLRVLKNPGPVRYHRPRKKKKSKIRKSNKLTLKESSKMALKKRRAKKRSHKRKTNPSRKYTKRNTGVKVYTANAHTKHHRKHRKEYRRKNPEGLGSPSLNLGNIVSMGGGAVVGGIMIPWVGSAFNLQGNTKYIGQIGLSIAGWWLLKKLLPVAAVPFAAAGVGVTAFEFAKDTNLLQGLNELLGLGWNPNAEDWRNLDAVQRAVRYNRVVQPHHVMNGIQPVNLSAIPFAPGGSNNLAAIPLQGTQTTPDNDINYEDLY